MWRAWAADRDARCQQDDGIRVSSYVARCTLMQEDEKNVSCFVANLRLKFDPSHAGG